jgi:hypothetical protein
LKRSERAIDMLLAAITAMPAMDRLAGKSS